MDKHLQDFKIDVSCLRQDFPKEFNQIRVASFTVRPYIGEKCFIARLFCLKKQLNEERLSPVLIIVAFSPNIGCFLQSHVVYCIKPYYHTAEQTNI